MRGNREVVFIGVLIRELSSLSQGMPENTINKMFYDGTLGDYQLLVAEMKPETHNLSLKLHSCSGE